MTDRLVVAGIDPGLTGAIVFLEHRDGALRVLGHEFMAQYTVKAPKGREYAVAEMAALVRKWSGRSTLQSGHVLPSARGAGIGLWVLERAQPHAGTPGFAQFSMGLSRGIWLGLLYGQPMIDVYPRKWQHTLLGHPAKDEAKSLAVAYAMRALPDLGLMAHKSKAKREALADAACIAMYGLTLRGIEAPAATA